MYWWQFNILIGTLAEVVERQVNVRTCQAHLNRPYDRLHEIIWNTPNSLPNTNHMQNHRGPSGRSSMITNTLVWSRPRRRATLCELLQSTTTAPYRGMLRRTLFSDIDIEVKS